MNKEETIYSFSRLESFNSCQYGYFLTYVKKLRSEDDNNIYGILGSEVHEILEDLQNKKTTKEEALIRFEEKVDEVLFLGMEFATEKSGQRYIEDLKHYFENYEPFDIDNFEIEEHFIVEVEGRKIQGYIDLYYIDKDGHIHIIDYKTSTKFSQKDFPKKTRQLILYGYALEQLNKGKVKTVGFDMLKYVEKPWRNKTTLKERCEVSDLENYPRALVIREFTDEAVEELREYIMSIIIEIESRDQDNPFDWKPMVDYRNSFFCKQLCEHYKTKNCQHHFGF